MRTPLIAGNWKMYKTLAEARALVSGIREGLSAALAGGSPPAPHPQRVEVLLCPPAQLLFPMAKAVVDSPIMLGAQNAHEEPQGAFTGEISVPMLADTGCSHVIIGHSERRHIFGEAGERLAKKVAAVLRGGLRVIYCVGETLAEREAGRTEDVIRGQLDDGLRGAEEGFVSVAEGKMVGEAHPTPSPFIIAYEPVWAIGTGRTATPEQAQEVHCFIRDRLQAQVGPAAAQAVRILYGGSVKPNNAAGLIGQPDVDGALVGGACLVAADFLAIIAAAASSAPKN